MAPLQLVVHPVHGYMIKPPEAVRMMKRNKRERNRVESVIRGFLVLRLHLPLLHGKVSKVCLFTFIYITSLT